jgi:hypothetical protein
MDLRRAYAHPKARGICAPTDHPTSSSDKLERALRSLLIGQYAQFLQEIRVPL